MLPYLFFIVLTLGLSVVYDGQTEYTRTKKAWYIIVGLYLILLAGFRNGVGGDTQQYMLAFEEVPSTWGELNEFIHDELIESGYMPGWSVLVFLCRSDRTEERCPHQGNPLNAQYRYSLSLPSIHDAYFPLYIIIRHQQRILSI